LIDFGITDRTAIALRLLQAPRPQQRARAGRAGGAVVINGRDAAVLRAIESQIRASTARHSAARLLRARIAIDRHPDRPRWRHSVGQVSECLRGAERLAVPVPPPAGQGCRLGALKRRAAMV
jgi:hypothetical protein